MRNPFTAVPIAAFAVAITASPPVSARENAASEAVANATGTLQNEADALLWRERTAPTPFSQKAFADAATQSISILAELRSWRETVRGNGAKPTRQIAGTTLLGEEARVALGVRAPGEAGVGGAGLAARWGRVEVGTTFRPEALEKALNAWDEAMSGQEIASQSPAQVHWIKAKPIESAGLSLEVAAIRAQRQLSNQTRHGDFLTSHARLNLPANWVATGQWTRGEVGEAEARNAWKTALSGPLAHPFGVAKAEVSLGQTEAGFQTLTAQNSAGERTASALVSQDVKLGRLGGELVVKGGQNERDEAETAREGEAIQSANALAKADLRLRLTPNLAIKARGDASALQTDKAAKETGEEIPFSSSQTQSLSGDVGLEWRFSSALKLAATAGLVRTENRERASGQTDWLDGAERAENRGALELRYSSGPETLAVKYARREQEFDGLTAQWGEVEALQLEAGRHLFSSLHLRTLFDFARDSQSPWSDHETRARSAQAQFSLNRALRLDLKWRDGALLPSSLHSDPLGQSFAALGPSFQTGDRQIAARFNAGSAVSGKGLGLALEYARHQRKSGQSEDDTWKVGLTFR